MQGVNKVILIGNLGKDPEIQFLEGNIAVAKFSLATSEKFKDKEGKVFTHTEWHNIVVWRGLAEMAQKYLQKGNRVYLEGRLKTRYWEDKDHRRNTVTEIIADNLVMMDKKEDEQTGQAEIPRTSSDYSERNISSRTTKN